MLSILHHRRAFWHFLPGLIILIIGMLTIHASVRLSVAHHEMQTHYNEVLQQFETLSGNPQEYVDHEMRRLNHQIQNLEKFLYWSVIGIGLTGFVLLVLNADKLRKLEQMNVEKQSHLEQLFQAQKMEAVGRLAGGFAHDFNNILAAMNGYAAFLIEDLPKGSQAHGFAHNILSAGRQARSLVDKILAFSRRNNSETEVFDLQEPLKECLSMLQASLPKTIEVHSEQKSDPAFLEGNANEISQLIMNLCLNAVDAMEGGRGVLNINLKPPSEAENLPQDWFIARIEDLKSSPLIRIDDLEPGRTRLLMGNMARDANYWCLSISDTGTGMSRAVLEHIFEPFFTTKSVEKGTGLGMSTVHGIIAGHHGAMMIETAEGQGSTFRIFFPKASESSTTQVKPTQEIIKRAEGRTILLVEDQKEVRDMTQTMLKRLGYKVDTASTGLAALDQLREKPGQYDLVITDQNMPEMTGLELVNEAILDFPDLPFVLLSGYSEKALQDLMHQHHAIKAIIRKPVEPEALNAKLAAVFDGKTVKKTRRKSKAS